MGVWGLSPQRGPGAEPLVRGSGGRSPPEAEHNYTFHKPIFTKFWCHFGKIQSFCKLLKLVLPVPWQFLSFGGAMASAVARAYNEGLGAVPQWGPGAEPLVRGSGGRRPPKLNTIIHFISQFSPNFGVILVKFKVSANC